MLFRSGGSRGAPNEVEFRYPDGTTYRPHLKDLVSGIPAGTVYRQVAGGGGGYGDPRERPVERVLEEARNGVISVESARVDYGVVVEPASWGIDDEATAELRPASRDHAAEQTDD